MHGGFDRVKNFLLVASLYSLAGCAIFGAGEDEVKNLKLQVQSPPTPFEEVKVSSADRVWQSQKTGSTIAYNSSCKSSRNHEAFSDLEKSIFEGIDHIKIIDQSKMTLDGAPAERTKAEGKSNGVSVSIDLIVIKKENCVYDLAYVARTLNFFTEEEIFNQFTGKFHAP